MSWPLPSRSPNTSVTGPNGQPMTPYTSPVKRFIGRMLDSSMQREWQTPLRTLRARAMLVMDRRLTAISGSALVDYDRPSFLARLAANEQLVPSTHYGATGRGEEPEMLLAPNRFWNAERALGWTLDHVDGNDRLFGFDCDDRGYTYVATNPYGWGIIGPNFEHVYQNFPSDITPDKIVCVKIGARYCVVVSWQAGKSAVFDVTVPSSPVRLGDLALTLGHWAKAPNGDVAIVFGAVRIYTPQGLIDGVPYATFAADGGAFQSVCCDESGNFLAVGANSGVARLAIISGGTKQEIDLGGVPYVNAVTVRAGAGWLAVFGQQQTGADLRLFRMNGLTPEEVNTGGYFRDVYGKKFAPPQSAVPIAIDGSGTPQAGDVCLFREGGLTYMGVAASGVWDFYELEDSGSPLPPPTVPPVTPPPPPPPPTTPPVVEPPAPPPATGKPALTKANCYIGGLDLNAVAKKGEEVYMQVQTIGWQITDEQILWDFGDGHREVSTDPVGAVRHTWTLTGDFTINLTVMRAGSPPHVVAKAIRITGTGTAQPPTPPPVEPPTPPPPPPPPPPPVVPPVPPAEPPSQPPSGPAPFDAAALRAQLTAIKTALDHAFMILDGPTTPPNPPPQPPQPPPPPPPPPLPPPPTPLPPPVEPPPEQPMPTKR